MISDHPGRAGHPAGRSGAAHLVGLGAAVARRGEQMAGPHRAVAAAGLAVRGAQGRTVTSFAAAYGIEETLVEALEAGRIPADQIPAPLRLLTPLCGLARAVAARTGENRGVPW